MSDHYWILTATTINSAIGIPVILVLGVWKLWEIINNICHWFLRIKSENASSEHKWWHWWFERDVTVPWRYKHDRPRWWDLSDGIERKFITCLICKRIVKQRYEDE